MRFIAKITSILVNIESLLGRATCFEGCAWNRNCFGGWMQGSGSCDTEVARLKKTLGSTTGVRDVHFFPGHPRLSFVANLGASDRVAIELDGGEIKKLQGYAI